LPNHLTAVDGVLYFTAFVPATGIERWRSDGTATGTVLVADIRPGGARSDPHELAFVNGALYFAANDGRNGTEPWVLRWDLPAAHAARPSTALAQESGRRVARTIAGDVFFGASGRDAGWPAGPARASRPGPRPGQPGPTAEAIDPGEPLHGGTSPPVALGGERPGWRPGGPIHWPDLDGDVADPIADRVIELDPAGRGP
jgi:ELWxxDGT repeat protein